MCTREFSRRRTRRCVREGAHFVKVRQRRRPSMAQCITLVASFGTWFCTHGQTYRTTKGTALDVPRTGRIFGWFFIGTFITSIPARLLFVHGLGASWTNVHFIHRAGSDTSLQMGAVFEFALIIANIATAVVIYPLVRRQCRTSMMRPTVSGTTLSVPRGTVAGQRMIDTVGGEIDDALRASGRSSWCNGSRFPRCPARCSHTHGVGAR